MDNYKKRRTKTKNNHFVVASWQDSWLNNPTKILKIPRNTWHTTSLTNFSVIGHSKEDKALANQTKPKHFWTGRKNIYCNLYNTQVQEMQGLGWVAEKPCYVLRLSLINNCCTLKDQVWLIDWLNCIFHCKINYYKEIFLHHSFYNFTCYNLFDN
jgi:hypothetical protein